MSHIVGNRTSFTSISPDCVVVTASDLTINGTLTVAGATLNLNSCACTSDTVTTAFYDQRDMATALLSGVSVTVNCGTGGSVTITLTDTGCGTNKLHSHNDPLKYIYHVAQFKVVGASDCAVTYTDPWRIPISRNLF